MDLIYQGFGLGRDKRGHNRKKDEKHRRVGKLAQGKIAIEPELFPNVEREKFQALR